jgi:AcrR family transcriptional regulator
MIAMPSTFDRVRAADARRRVSASSETEHAIFDATERLLGRMQLHDVSVAKITAEAEISRATFYRYFTSKDAVIAGLLAKVMDEIFDAIAQFVGASEDDRPGPILRDALAGGWQVWNAHQPVMRAVSENWHRVPELEQLWLSIIDRFSGAIAAQIDRERAAGLAPPGIDSRRLAAMLLWSTERLMYVAAREDDVAGTLGPVTDLWLQAIYGVTHG